MDTNTTNSILSASTSSELVDAMNKASHAGMTEDEVLAVVKQSDLFDQELMNNIEFLYEEDAGIVVHSNTTQHFIVIRIVWLDRNNSWEADLLDVSKPVVSLAKSLLDEVSNADVSQWPSVVEFLQHVYSHTTYWVSHNLLYAGCAAEDALLDVLHRNGFEVDRGHFGIESEMTAYLNGDKFTLNNGIVEEW